MKYLWQFIERYSTFAQLFFIAVGDDLLHSPPYSEHIFVALLYGASINRLR